MAARTKCVWKRDEWGNDHDGLQYASGFADVAALITKASLNPRGAVTKIIITRDKRIIWFTMEFRSALSFCEERKIEELDEKTLKKICDLIREGDTIRGSLRISVDVYDEGLVRSICGGD